MPQEKPLVLTEENEALQLYPRPPILTSLDVGWHGVTFGYMCQPAYEVPEVSTPRWHSIAIFTHGNRVIHAERKLDGRFHRDAVVGGDIVINPVNVGQSAAWDAEGDFIILGIEPDVFARTINESADGKDVELLPHFATPDPLIYQIGLALKSVLENNPTNSRLYAETMINALSVHLMQHYSTCKPILPEYKDGFSKYKFKKVIDYINAHLEQDLSLTELAALVQISPHYFSHLFKQSMGISAHQYVIRCRVERAKNLLLQGNLSLAEVAYKVGFANQSHLNRHFKRLLGVTPKQILS
ncbi:helix-turn-helix transcriptional regulator [Scytonema hofmannii FACHB-248]|uniref:Helix-turn-helix transcriptional regulator n=1 Tax=Scytonema hofmannii FACHB-248 TaxID=1842502 RepID=A0ABR8GZW1_9CYAN|nr:MULTISPECIES: AraC family transcriptional regulator [Nostocales]MBD2608694.1 helix-turn-helix transcriptional regulator [Scytonema hofmannii FACHB-248]